LPRIAPEIADSSSSLIGAGARTESCRFRAIVRRILPQGGARGPRGLGALEQREKALPIS
jgi:hypothetical protein